MSAMPESTTLDLPLPARRHQTLGLVLLRRIAKHGLHDARATMLAMDATGLDFRKLLVICRALVVDLARTSRRKIVLAPCCASGMTRDEGLLMALIGGAGLDVFAALTDDARCRAAMTTARALGQELDRIALRNDWRR